MSDATSPASTAGVNAADLNGDDSFIKVPAATASAPVAAAPAATEASEPTPGQEPPTEAEYDFAISECTKAVDEAKQALKRCQERLSSLEGERDAVISEKERLFPPMNHAQSVRAHLAREAQRREDRVRAANSVNAAVGQTVIPPRASALDASIAGRRRGQVPLIATPPAQS